MRQAILFTATVLLASVAFAQTPPALKIADTAGNSVLIDGIGNVTCVGSCSATSTTSAGGGKVTWSGILGSFTVNVLAGQTKPYLDPPQILLNVLVMSSTPGKITATWSDVGFTGSGPIQMNAAANISNATVVYSGYVDDSNTLFGSGTLVGSFTQSDPGGFTQVSGPGPATTPFSMTAVMAADMGANGTVSLPGLRLQGVPACAGSVGDFVWADANFNGIQDAGELGIDAVTVQLYKDSVSPANLLQTTTTGPTPTGYGLLPDGAPGYYRFTGLCGGNYYVVVDSGQSALTGYTASPALQGGNTAVDSNGLASPVPVSAFVSLPSNTADATIDFGFAAGPKPDLTCPASTGEVGVLYSSALVATNGFQPYTFSSPDLPSWLTLVPNTGSLTGTPTAPGPITFTAQVVDARGNAAGTTSKSCAITISVPTMSCLSAAASTGVVGAPFNPPAPAVSGGATPYKFTVVGVLPGGLTLNPDGSIGGIPTEAGSFSLKVTDANGVSATTTCPYTILPAPSANCVAITAYQYFQITPVTLTGSGGAGGPYTFSAVGLPSGLTISPAGVISGIPTVTGNFSYTVTVKDAAGNVGTISCSVTVNPPARIIVNKVTDPATDTTTVFTFATSGSGYTGFTLKNGQSNTSAYLVPGSYSVTENSLSGWTLLNLSCTAPSGSSAVVNGATATISLASGATVSCTYTNGAAGAGSYCSFTPGAWGAPPRGGNVATKLYAHFPALYPDGVAIGGASPYHAMTFTSASAVTAYLPDGGTPGVLTNNYTNPASTESHEFGSQVTALRFNVDFSDSGVIALGFATRKVVSGPLAGLTTAQVLALAQAALSGNTSVLAPYQITVAQFTEILSKINQNYDNCSTNGGYLQ